MKIQIIGGGISGLLTALMARMNQHEVVLYEMSSQIGGILRDYFVNDDWYFHNTQYINAGSLCHHLLKEYIKADLIEFDHNYGSITQQVNDEEIFHADFAQPVFGNAPPYISQYQKVPSGIDELLSLYQSNYLFLKTFAQRFGNIDTLHLSSTIPMQLSRVFYQNYVADLIDQKQNNAVADLVFGVPRTILKPNFPKQKALLPAFGYNKMLENIEDYLWEIGITIVKNQPITPKRDSNEKLKFYAKNKQIIADKTIWCGNPTPLIFQELGYKLSNQALKMYCAVGECGYLPNLRPIYIQVFNLNSTIVRFFVYNHNNKTKITVEGLGHIYDKQKIEQQINYWLTTYFSTQLKSNLAYFNEKRYTLLTHDDFEKIQFYSAISNQSGVIAGGWELYGRDAKLEILNKAIQAL